MSRSIVVCGILNIKFQPYYNLEILKVKVISKLFWYMVNILVSNINFIIKYEKLVKIWKIAYVQRRI